MLLSLPTRVVHRARSAAQSTERSACSGHLCYSGSPHNAPHSTSVVTMRELLLSRIKLTKLGKITGKHMTSRYCYCCLLSSGPSLTLLYCSISEVGESLLTVGAHAQEGYCLSVCVSVKSHLRLFVLKILSHTKPATEVERFPLQLLRSRVMV